MAPIDPNRYEDNTKNRRTFLQAVGAAGVLGLAGCLGDDDDEADDSDDSTDADDSDDGTDVDDGQDDEPTGSENFEISGLSPRDTSIVIGDELTVSADVTNTGNEQGTQDIEMRVDGVALADEEVTLDAFESEEVVFEAIETDDLEPGEFTHGVYSEDDAAEGTLTVEEPEPLDDPLLVFGTDVISTGTAIIHGSLNSGYSFDIQDGDVSLSVPDGWEITDESGTSFDELAAFGSQDVQWELDVPGDADGEYDLEATITYAANGRESGELEATGTVVILQAISAPYGLNVGGISGGRDLDADAIIEYDGVDFVPYNESIDPDPAITLIEDHNESGSNDQVKEIEGTDADELYETMMWSSDSFGYEMLVEPGTYDITIHIAEIHYVDGPGEDQQRTFSGWVNNELVFEDIAPWEEPLTAMPQTIEGVEVEGEPLLIEFESSIENPMINGIEIRESD